MVCPSHQQGQCGHDQFLLMLLVLLLLLLLMQLLIQSQLLSLQLLLRLQLPVTFMQPLLAAALLPQKTASWMLLLLVLRMCLTHRQ